MEGRRSEFRNYLETSGAITALTNVLIKLYDMKDKPENSVQFIVQNMGGGADLQQENEKLKRELEETRIRLLGYEPRISDANTTSDEDSNNKPPASIDTDSNETEKTETVLALEDGLKNLNSDENCKSLVKHFLTNEIIHDMANVVTGNGASLLDCVKVGFDNHESSIGFIAADADSYNVFDTLLDPIIRKYHGFEDTNLKQPDIEWGDVSALTNPDPENEYIKKCQVNCYRSLEGHPFFLKMDENKFVEVMETIRTYAQETEQEEFFYDLETIDAEKRKIIDESMTLGQLDYSFDFETGQTHSAQWPKGRAVCFPGPDQMAIRVNHKTHVQFGYVQVDGNLLTMYERICDYAKGIEEKLKFARHEKYGWLSPFPEYLGTAMELRALVKLHQLPVDTNKAGFHTLLSTNGLALVAMEMEENFYHCDLKNVRCCGMSEIQLMKQFCDALAAIIEADRQLLPK